MKDRTLPIENFIYENASHEEVKQILLKIRETLDDSFYEQAPNRCQMDILQSLKVLANDVAENFYLEAK